MRTNRKERDLILCIFWRSLNKTENWASGSTIFEKILYDKVSKNQGIHREYIGRERIQTPGGLFKSYKYVYNLTPFRLIYTNFEAMMDRLEDIKELIHVQEATSYKGHRRVWLQVSSRIREAFYPFEEQLKMMGAQYYSLDAETLLDQLLKGLILEL